MARKIYIGKLPKTVTNEQLRELFAKKGTVISVNITTIATFQDNMNYGYIEMGSDAETKEVIKTMNNFKLGKSHIKVMEAHGMDQAKSSYYQPRRRRN